MVEFFRPLSADKHVYVEIIGGDADGLILDSKSENPTDRKLVDQLLYCTSNGKLYHGMKGNSLTNQRANIDGTATGSRYSAEFSNMYFVSNYIEDGDEVLIRMTYRSHKDGVRPEDKTG